MCGLIFVLVNIIISKAKYQKTESIKVVSGTINYSVKNVNIIHVKEQTNGSYTEKTTIPKGNYTLNTSHSYCTQKPSADHITNVTFNYNSTSGTIDIQGIPNIKVICHLYFDKISSEGVLAQLGQKSNGTASDFSKTACDNGTNRYGTNCTSTDKGVYQTTDDYGTSYYYRGTVNNNWVKFAGYWWRIIRINGNGSIRLIYSGNSSTVPEDGRWSDSNNSQTTTSAYNSDYGDNTYVGFYNGKASATDYDSAHNNSGGPSTIATAINNWYTTSKLNSYSQYLDGATGWCNDRVVDNTYQSGKAYGTNNARYQPEYRLTEDRNPILTCTNKSRDLFTTNDTSTTNDGNKKLTVPVGLISADEVAMAGGMYDYENINYGYWLYTGAWYWTMSPFDWFGAAHVFYVAEGGGIFFSVVSGAIGVRPVINLKAGTTLKTTSTTNPGTVSNPYIVS